MDQGHDLHQIADVKGIGGRIKANIAGSHFLHQLSFSSRHEVMDHAPPAQFFDKILILHKTITSKDKALVQFRIEPDLNLKRN